MTIKEILVAAAKDHQAGKFQSALNAYQKVLSIEPNQADANHNIGLILVTFHRSKEALSFLKKALDSNPRVELFWISYIDALLKANAIDAALAALKIGEAVLSDARCQTFIDRTLTPSDLLSGGKLLQALDNQYLDFFRVLHNKSYDGYFEIGTRKGSSLQLSQSPSVAIDPFFQLTHNPIGNKNYCLLFQETSDSFFQNTLHRFSDLKCQLAFIDGMHLFEFALRDFINLCKCRTEDALFLFHDPLPWTYEMATRDNTTLGRNEAWTGDIWKLIPILIAAGFKDHLKVITAAPSGLLAIFNPPKELVEKLEEDYEDICRNWINIEFNKQSCEALYQPNVFVKPEAYLHFLEEKQFGNNLEKLVPKWVSQ